MEELLVPDHNPLQPKQMDQAATIKHFMTHYNSALRELSEDNLWPDEEGILRFAMSLILTDVFRRSAAARIPWDHVLSHVAHQTYKLAQKIYAMNKGQGAVEESDEDL